MRRHSSLGDRPLRSFTVNVSSSVSVSTLVVMVPVPQVAPPAIRMSDSEPWSPDSNVPRSTVTGIVTLDASARVSHDDDDHRDHDDEWSRTPVRIEGNHDWKQVSAGDDFACGVTTGDAAYCWGSGDRDDDDD